MIWLNVRAHAAAHERLMQMRPHPDRHRINAALALTGASAAWPSALCAAQAAMLSPLQQAMQDAWCGAPAQMLLGHCPTCWGGAAAFLAAALVLTLPSRSRLRAR